MVHTKVPPASEPAPPAPLHLTAAAAAQARARRSTIVELLPERHVLAMQCPEPDAALLKAGLLAEPPLVDLR